MSALNWIKSHPWETGLIIFGTGALIVIYANSGSSSATSTSTQDPNADALAAQEDQDQTALQGAAISAGVQNNQTAASVTNTTTAAGVQENADSLSAQTSQIIASLEASVSNNQTSAALQESLAQTSALQTIALAPYQVEEDELNSTANSELNSLQSDLDQIASAVDSAGSEVTGNAPGGSAATWNSIQQAQQLLNQAGASIAATKVTT